MPIFDQGYQHWQGARARPVFRGWTITQQGVRVEYRWWLARWATLLGLFPALALAGFFILWGLFEQKTSAISWLFALLPEQVKSDPKAYRTLIWTIGYQFFFKVQMFWCMLIVVLVGPRLISQDLRFNAIPLYLSRPLRRWDYFVGKWGVIAYFVGLVCIVPPVLAWVLGACFSFDLAVLRDTWRVGLAGVGYGLIIVVSAGTLMLAFSSLTRNSRYVMIIWFAFWIITNVVASVLGVDHEARLAHARFRQMQQRQVMRGQDQSTNAAAERAAAEMAEIDKEKPWWLVISYTGDLQRLGDDLLGARAAWDKWQQVIISVPGAPVRYEGPQLADMMVGHDYPWYWSAGVVAGLFGLSVLVLCTRVRTLDRLK